MGDLGRTFEDVDRPLESWIFCSAQKLRKCIEQALENSPDALTLLDQADRLWDVLHTDTGVNHLCGTQMDLDVVKFTAIGTCKSRWNPPYIVAAQLLDFEDSILQLARMMTAKNASPERKLFWEDHGDAFLDATKFSTLRQLIDVLRPAAEFIEAVSERYPEVSRLYPKIKEVLNDETVPLVPSAAHLKSSLVTELRTTFPFDGIPDETLMATFLNPANVGGPLLETVIDGVKLADKAEGLLRDAQAKLLESKAPLYTNRHGTDFSAVYAADSMQRRLGYDLTEYNHLVRQGDAGSFEVEEWWKKNQDSLPFLAPLARIYLSVQASPADSKPYFVISKAMFTKENRSLGSQALGNMVLLKSWFSSYVKGEQVENTEIESDEEE